MGKTIIVSIISEHNLPNISLVRNITADYYLDILTEKSKKEYYDHYLNAVTDDKTSYITDRFENIIVDESNAENIISQLSTKSYMFDEAEKIYINVTGGTKLLSLYSYIFFKEHYFSKSTFYYMNITSSSNVFIDLDTKKNIEMKNVVSLKQYLRSYQYVIAHEGNENFSYNAASVILKEFTGQQYIQIRSLLNDLLDILNNRYLKNKSVKAKELYDSFNIRDIIDELKNKFGEKQKYKNTIANIFNNKTNICQFIDNIAEKVNHPKFRNSANMNIKTFRYIISTFLEEYIYYFIKEEIFKNTNQENMAPENLKQSLRLENISNQNKNDYIPELDVLFYYNNILCYIECKSGTYPELIKNSTIKQKAISSTLGISAYSLFVVLNEFKTESEKNTLKNLRDKADSFKIKIITKEDLLNGTFISTIKKYCKINV